MLAVLKHTRTEVCSKTAEHAKMLVFYLKGKSKGDNESRKGVKVANEEESINEARKGEAGEGES